MEVIYLIVDSDKMTCMARSFDKNCRVEVIQPSAAAALEGNVPGNKIVFLVWQDCYLWQGEDPSARSL